MHSFSSKAIGVEISLPHSRDAPVDDDHHIFGARSSSQIDKTVALDKHS